MKYTETSFRASARGIFLGLVQEKEEVIRKAFTMLELVFVMVVVGILSVMIAPNFQGNNLRQAADQVVSHIRYTQHLAMMDNKFDPNDSDWYKERWQIFFANTSGSGDAWSYMIFSDYTGDSTGSPDVIEHAKNPLDNSKYLSGGYSDGNINSVSDLATKEMNIGNEYGILDVDFTGGCNIAITRERLFFDYQGRPFYGIAHMQTSPYKDETNVKLLKTQCRIELCLETCTTASSKNKITIAIEPETGYTHIL